MRRDVVEMRALRAAARDREGVLREDACERLRHAARRYAARVYREAWA